MVRWFASLRPTSRRSVGLRALSGAHSNDLIAPPLLMHFTVGLVDEVIMRGILIRVVQKSAGSKLALLASALLCSAVHMFNDNVSAIRRQDKVNLYRYHTTSVFNTGQGFTVKALP